MTLISGFRPTLARLAFFTVALGVLSTARALALETMRCTCADGHPVETGEISYSINSDRETITRIEATGNAPDSRCKGIWVTSTRMHTRGGPYQFFLQRTTLGERRFSGCGDLDDKFVKRSKTYSFVFDSNSVSIREMRSVSPLKTSHSAEDPKENSNQNLWNAIVVDDERGILDEEEEKGSLVDSRHEEFNRTSWVFARRNVKAHYLGILKDIDQSQHVVSLKKSHVVEAGQLGQIEATSIGRAIVRFYEGSRIEKFGKAKNAFRQWYDNVGGPYEEAKDDLYTSVRAYIVEVALDDIIEVNDYLDQQKTDRTGAMNLWDIGSHP